MQSNNPAAAPCPNIEKGNGAHDWIRRADGTAECANCAVRLDPTQVKEAFAGAGGEVKRKAAGRAAKA